MRSVVRSVLAVVAGFVAASVVMMIVEAFNGRVIYPELGKLAEGVTDREVIRQLFAGAPIGALLVVVFGWALGSLTGGLVAAWIGASAPVLNALVVGVLLTAGGVANNLMLPPPLWFWVAGLVVLLPSSFAGGRIVVRFRPTRIQR